MPLTFRARAQVIDFINGRMLARRGNPRSGETAKRLARGTAKRPDVTQFSWRNVSA